MGITLVAGSRPRCSMDRAKKSFNRAVNSIFSKILGVASEVMLVHLIKVKCMPILLYATEVLGLQNSIIQSLDFCVIRFAMKLFRNNNRDFVLDRLHSMNLLLPSQLISARYHKFMNRFLVFGSCFCRHICGLL